MLTFVLAIPAFAGNLIVIDGGESAVLQSTVVISEEDHEDHEDHDVDDDEAPRRDQRFSAGSSVVFLPDGAAQSLYGRVESRKDGYFELYGRGSPCGCWVGRVGAGFDLFGDGAFDLNLGVFLGAAGTDLRPGRAAVSAGPQGGTQIAVGIDGKYLLARYTWVAGFGGGLEDSLLTENQLLLGVKVARFADVYGEALYVEPGQTGVGIGARLTF